MGSGRRVGEGDEGFSAAVTTALLGAFVCTPWICCIVYTCSGPKSTSIAAGQLQFHVPLVLWHCPATPFAACLLHSSWALVVLLPPENKMKLFCCRRCRRLGFEFFLVCRTAAAVAASVAPEGVKAERSRRRSQESRTSREQPWPWTWAWFSAPRCTEFVIAMSVN